MKNRAVVIEGVQNARDLGGISTENGGKTRSGRFIRGAALHHITAKGMAQMKELGIKHVVDLRSVAESERNPDITDLTKLSVPMLDNMQSKITDFKSGQGAIEFPDSIDGLYYLMIDTHKDEFKNLFKYFAANPDDGMFYHCSIGKDRTGVTSMLLLSIAGVSREDIVADYNLSKPLEGNGPGDNPNVPAYVYEAPKVAMENTLDWLEEKYGGPLGYLKHIGVTGEEIETIRKSMLE